MNCLVCGSNLSVRGSVLNQLITSDGEGIVVTGYFEGDTFCYDEPLKEPDKIDSGYSSFVCTCGVSLDSSSEVAESFDISGVDIPLYLSRYKNRSLSYSILQYRIREGIVLPIKSYDERKDILRKLYGGQL